MRRAALFAFLVLNALIAFAAQDPTFVLTTEKLEPYVRPYLGNGYFSVLTSQWGSKPEYSYMVRLYAHAPDDVPRLATLPAWNEVNVYNGSFHTRYDWTDERVTSIAIDTFISRADPHLAVVRLAVTPRYSGPILSLLDSLTHRPARSGKCSAAAWSRCRLAASSTVSLIGSSRLSPKSKSSTHPKNR